MKLRAVAVLLLFAVIAQAQPLSLHPENPALLFVSWQTDRVDDVGRALRRGRQSGI